MSNFDINLIDKKLFIKRIRARMTEKDTLYIDIETLEYNKKYNSELTVNSLAQRNKILFMEEVSILENKFYNSDDSDDDNQPDNDDEDEELVEHKNVLVVWTNDKRVQYGYMNLENFYKEIVKFKYKVLSVNVNKRKLSMIFLGYLLNPYKVKVQDTKFFIDEQNNVDIDLKESVRQLSKKKLLNRKNLHFVSLPVENLLKDTTHLNNMINMVANIEGFPVEYRIGKKFKGRKNTRFYFAPYKATYCKNFAVHIRRSNRGNFAVVKRLIEPIERTLHFKLFESKFFSFCFYYTGKAMKRITKKQVNLFYEKFSEKAEEGTFDLFVKALESQNSSSYYIIDENSPDYEKIKHVKNVVKKYSFKYYWLLYRANNYISTEAPAHLNILRSNNSYFRKTTCENKFVFLQHGVTYMKCQGPTSTFIVGKEGEPAYIVVGSEKEKDVVSDMLKLPEERILNTGLPIFSKIKYNHINQESADKVVVMLTWKSYEEHLLNFETSDYYKNVIAICDMLKKYMKDSQIIVVAHPKVRDLIEQTDLKETLWNGPISEVLQYAKMLITDYSSVCYNSFYQGGGVVFFQPDLKLYESVSGKLIPNDDEYIGKRVFDLESLEHVISDVVVDGIIQLDQLRTKRHEEIYHTINEFNDGYNIERIYDKLKKIKMI